MKPTKILPYLILGLLLIGVLFTTIAIKQRQDLRQHAAPGTYLSIISTNTSPKVGEQLIADVTIDTTDLVAAAELVVSYDPTKLRADSIGTSSAAFLPNVDSFRIDNSIGQARITLLSSPTTPPTGTGTLATLTFLVLQTGDTTVNLTSETGVSSAEQKGVNVLSSIQPLNLTLDAASTSAEVRIEPTSITTTIGAMPTQLSALAYDTNGQPMYSGVTYEWGISSINSVGSLASNNNLASFTPYNNGTGDIWVTATSLNGSVQNSIRVTVGSINPSPTPSESPTNICVYCNPNDTLPNHGCAIGTTCSENICIPSCLLATPPCEVPLPICPSPTPDPTPSPSPSLTPSPTLSSSPIATPSTIPSTTPETTPSPSTAQVMLTFQLEGVTNPRQYASLFSITLLNQQTGDKMTNNAVIFENSVNGHYTNTNDPLSVTPSTYDIYVTGPANLTQLFANQQLTLSQNTLDLTATALLTGDTNGDNQVDGADYARLVDQFGCKLTNATQPAGKNCFLSGNSYAADVDLDGDVDIFDFSHLVRNFGQSGVTTP